VALGTSLAGALGAEFDVTLSRMLRSFDQPNLAIGALSETGNVYLFPGADPLWETSPDYDEFLEHERRHQLSEVDRLKLRYRAIRPQAVIKGRSVVLVDDGTASEPLLVAILKVLRAQGPYEVRVILPAVTSSTSDSLRLMCDEVIPLSSGGSSNTGTVCDERSPCEQGERQMLRDLSATNQSTALANAS